MAEETGERINGSRSCRPPLYLSATPHIFHSLEAGAVVIRGVDGVFDKLIVIHSFLEFFD